jgi:NAD+ kinase
MAREYGLMIKKIGIVANIEKEKSLELTLRLRKWAEKRGVEVYLEEQIAGRLDEREGLDRKTLAGIVDLLVVLGGDGTMLRTARAVREMDVPIVGINLGGFGYLNEVNVNEMDDALEMIIAGKYQTEKRMMLDVVISRGDGGQSRERTVLNDVVINRGNLSRIVELETSVNDRYLATFKADGLILSTPTGSTAYSLSAGGPIVFPQQDSIIINPICPHTLTNRPIILPENALVKILLWSKEMGATVNMDGQASFILESGDTVTVKKSRYMTKLVTSPHRDYMEILRTKLGWGGFPTGTGK